MLSERGIFDKGLKIRSMILPDQFIDQDTPENMYKTAGLDAQAIEQKILDALNIKYSYTQNQKVPNLIKSYLSHCARFTADNDPIIHKAS